MTDEDNALNSRSNLLLTFNSLLAIALVGILQEAFDIEWQRILIIAFPAFAIVLNILWMWLRSRTALSFSFLFFQQRKAEAQLENIINADYQHYELFQYAKNRSEYWKSNNICLLRIISIAGGANNLYCFVLPHISYLIWAALIIYIFKTYCSDILAVVMLFLELVVWVLFVLIGLTILIKRKKLNLENQVASERQLNRNQ